MNEAEVRQTYENIDQAYRIFHSNLNQLRQHYNDHSQQIYGRAVSIAITQLEIAWAYFRTFVANAP